MVDTEILSSSAAANGVWTSVQNLKRWSLYVNGLESGGTIQIAIVYGYGLGQQPSDAEQGMTVFTITANGVYAAPQVAPWLRVVKTAGGSPTLTTVRLYGEE